MPRAVVIGLGVTGPPVCRHLQGLGFDVVVVEDRPSSASATHALELGVDLVPGPSDDTLRSLIAGSDLLAPNPGVPPAHPAFAFARDQGVPVMGEIELGWRAAQAPIVAITGSNGKTTVTTLVERMLQASGLRALAAGNIGLPLVEAVARPGVEVLVVEVSSGQLMTTVDFRPRVATWLNFAEDHLDFHPDMEHYAWAKARIWANQGGDDVAVANADDAAVMAALPSPGPRVVTFGAGGEWRVVGDALCAPDGRAVVAVADMPRSLPHELGNALAALATTIAAGGDEDAAAQVLREFHGLPHRVQLVGEAGGVRYYDDSKATTPASVLAALSGFDSVVLIAGGRNKGLDLGVLTAEHRRLRAVVTIGEAGPEVRRAFDGVKPVEMAASMDDAVARATRLAEPGDVVLLSPGCTSWDAYRNYGERGDDFARAVGEMAGAQ
ncbi:MAG TPA: UDP-N-acetylmuramoyl-L-alanine--D-glutamate ligase [Acidimicrobiales bacterium]|nr:UDP-N-acetylmuramoyl-L-alanine--D-glutamate ligase [Acidimicrobiales bacterium]